MRGYILAHVQVLGLPTEVASGRRNDVLITAQYDYAPSYPVAEDNEVPVAAMLETMRVLEAGEPLENDIVLAHVSGQ